ncbi:MAG: phosphopantetheine-binding protein [Oscillospiraceae bacterium]|nr:phosphopantetheine-binding protein [Oscillospiraceae bacterium]
MTYERLVKIIAECKDLDPGEITLASTFKDLDLDSLDLAELAMQVEDEFDITVELSEELSNVGKLVDYIEAKIK